MPLLENGHHICPVCLSLHELDLEDWILNDADPTVFSTPMCECGTSATFCWHDDIALKEVSDRRSVGKIDPDGPEQFFDLRWIEPDPDHHQARQMATIEKVARRLGRRQKLFPPRERSTSELYPRAPLPYTKAEAIERAVDEYERWKKLPPGTLRRFYAAQSDSSLGTPSSLTFIGVSGPQDLFEGISAAREIPTRDSPRKTAA